VDRTGGDGGDREGRDDEHRYSNGRRRSSLSLVARAVRSDPIRSAEAALPAPPETVSAVTEHGNLTAPQDALTRSS